MGRSIGLAVGGSCQSSSAGWCWTVFRRNHRSAKRPSACGKTSHSMMGRAERHEDGHAGSPEQAPVTLRRERLVWTPRKRGLQVTGLDLPKRVERSVPPCLTPTELGSSRTWTRRWTWLGQPGTYGRSARSSRAGGGWCSLASTVAGGGRRPTHSCAAVLSPSGSVNRLAATSIGWPPVLMSFRARIRQFDRPSLVEVRHEPTWPATLTSRSSAPFVPTTTTESRTDRSSWNGQAGACGSAI
jgi:hypothetical protein